MRRAQALAGLLVLAGTAWPLLADNISNPRNYPVDILAETFGYGAEDVAVPLREIFQGCDRRDCIASVDEPTFVRAADLDSLADDDLLLVVEHGGIIKAYPTRYLDVHEIVNDEFAGTPVVVTFCPLCGSGLAFRRTVGGEVTEFGVSGLLHNNDLIMYDRQTGSLWQQITGAALAGPQQGIRLENLPVSMNTLADWRAANPDAWVLRPPRQDLAYGPNPYGSYVDSDRLLFPVRLEDARLHPKKVIHGIELGDRSIAVDHEWLVGEGGWTHAVDSVEIRLEVGAGGGVSGTADGKPLVVHRMFWFAWYSFHPETALIPGD